MNPDKWENKLPSHNIENETHSAIKYVAVLIVLGCLTWYLKSTHKDTVKRHPKTNQLEETRKNQKIDAR